MSILLSIEGASARLILNTLFSHYLIYRIAICTCREVLYGPAVMNTDWFGPTAACVEIRALIRITPATKPQQFAEVDNQLCGANNNPLGIWGDPVIHPMGWESHDPTFLAPNLGSLSIYIASGNGVPCPDDVAPDPFLMFAEATVFEMSQHLDAALTATGVSHVTDFYGCGLHLYSKVSRDLRHWWPQMLAAFGENDLGQAEDAGAPPTFDYRTGDTVAAVWGWQFRADPARAPEFLDIRHASVDRLRVTGSGAASFTTPPFFRPGESVSVAGAGPLPVQVRAGSDCRLTFTVDLGPPHSLEQGTTAELMAAAANTRQRRRQLAHLQSCYRC